MKSWMDWLRGHSLIWLGVIFGTAFYVADAAMDVYLFDEGAFFDQLLYPDPIEAWMRLSVLVLSSLFGFYAHVMLQRSRTAEQFFSTIVENIPDMVFIKDPKYLRFLRMNHAGEKLLGRRGRG